MNYFRIEIPIITSTEHINIIPIGDIHFGQPYSNKAKALQFRDFVLQTPDTYTIDMGDDMDNVLRESVGDIYEQIYSPFKQHQEAIEFWKPLSEANKLFCVMEDNHSRRSKEITDVRWTEDMCDKIKTRYGGFGAFLDLIVGKYHYTIYVTHGKGSSTTPGGVLNSLIKMNTRCLADIYLRGHHHQKMIHQDEIKRYFRGKLAEHKRTYGVTGSFLEWDNSYAEAKEYPISVKGCIKLKLFVNYWDVHISL